MKFTKIKFKKCLTVMLLTLIATSSHAGAVDAQAVTQVADQFSQALKDGDEATVRKVLDENVLIFESGGVESSLAEYASHHMSADMAFMAGMDHEILSRTVFEEGNTAVISTRYRMTGKYKEQDFDKVSSETMVLRKSDSGWKIVHIHWS